MFESLEQELKLGGYSGQTRERYIWFNRDFISFAGKEPRAVSGADVRRYLEYLRDRRGYSSASMRLAWNALRFYYFLMWKRPFFGSILLARWEKKLLVVLTKEEVGRMVAVTVNPKHRVILLLLYGAGLRLNEIVNLRWEDILVAEKRGVVRRGKGSKDRYFIIPRALIWYFSRGSSCSGSAFDVTGRTVEMIVKHAAWKAGVRKRVSPHTLRHSFAMHLLENGTDIRVIQELLGHESLRTTQVYTWVSAKNIENVMSPADGLVPTAIG